MCKVGDCKSVGRSRKKGDITSDNVVPMVTLGRESVWVDMLPQLVGTRRDISDINPLAVKVSAVVVTTVCGDALLPCSTAIATYRTEKRSIIQKNELTYILHSMLRAYSNTTYGKKIQF